jgi:hypothetical protein
VVENRGGVTASPDAGRATWRLRSETGDDVDVVVHAPRVWWAFTADGDEEKPHAWTDALQTLSTDDLLPTSPMRLSVLLPEPGWGDEVSVGFRDGSPWRVPVPRSDRVLHYPLRNLGEDDAVRRAIASYRSRAMGWKLSGAGGGGYLILVSERQIPGTMQIKIRRG